MPRAVPVETARRRRERLAEFIEALGVARGQRVTQREFAASIGREQGTVAAILGGDRALGADVMMAVVQTYRLPSDYFDRPLRPDPRPYARAAVTGATSSDDPSPAPAATKGPGVSATGGLPPQAMPDPPPSIASAMHGAGPVTGWHAGAPSSDAALAETLAVFSPDRSVAIALEALARRGVREDALGWERLLIGAQSAQDLGILLRWFDETLAARTAHPLAQSSDEPDEVQRPRPSPRG
jgi:hypothetical protein